MLPLYKSAKNEDLNKSKSPLSYISEFQSKPRNPLNNIATMLL
nr:MAG TPA: hypothetical protein [Caudoviricetes sp.]